MVGGGLAALATALHLRRLGHRVALVGGRSRRSGGVVSATPTIVPVFAALGLERAFLEASFPSVDRVDVRWGAMRRRDAGTGWLVPLEAMRRLLWDAVSGEVLELDGGVRDDGADGWRVESSARSVRASWRVLAHADDAASAYRPLGPPTVCRVRAATGAARADTAVRVRSHSAGWRWTAATRDGSIHALSFRDGAPTGPEELDVTPRIAVAPIGERSVSVGSACMRLDPLSSQGTQQALATALRAATVIHTAVRHPGDVEAARAFYDQAARSAAREHVRKRAAHHRRALTHHPTAFWRDRADDGEPAFTPRPDSVPLERHLKIGRGTTLGRAPRLDGARIRWGSALHHPALAGPVAYVGELEASDVVREVAASPSLAWVLARTPTPIRAAKAAAVDWLWRQGVLDADAD